MDISGTGEQKIAVGQRGQTQACIISTYSEAANQNEALPRHFYRLSINQDQEKFKKFVEQKGGFSHRRLLADVNKNVALIRYMFNGFFDIDDGGDQHGLSLQNILDRKPSVIQFSTAARNSELKKLGSIVQNLLKNYLIVVISGEGGEQDDATTNAKAEDLVKQKILEAKVKNKEGVIIFSANMAQRSFSVSEIEAVVLLYDGGSISSNVQRGSRSATEGYLFDETLKTKSIVISVSVDDVQDDKCYELIIHDALLQSRKNGTTIVEELRVCYQNYNIYRMVYGTPIVLKEDEFIYELTQSQIMDRIAEADDDFEKLFNDEYISSLLYKCDIDCPQEKMKASQRKALLDKVKTSLIVSPAIKENEDEDSLENEELKKEQNRKMRIIHALLMIKRTAPSIAILAGKKTLIESLNTISEDPILTTEFLKQYSIDIGTIVEIFTSGHIDLERCDFMISRRLEKISKEHENLWK